MECKWNIIFVGGIHGVGKTTFCKNIVKKSELEHFSSSELISMLDYKRMKKDLCRKLEKYKSASEKLTVKLAKYKKNRSVIVKIRSYFFRKLRR